MYIVDTNVLSDLRRPERADPQVRQWASETAAEDLYVSVISIWEIEQGILRLARRDQAQASVINRWFEDHVLTIYATRLLQVDLPVVRACAPLHVPNVRSYRDSLIGATALALRMTVVTRNVSDFEPLGVPILNPWQPDAAD